MNFSKKEQILFTYKSYTFELQDTICVVNEKGSIGKSRCLHQLFNDTLAGDYVSVEEKITIVKATDFSIIDYVLEDFSKKLLNDILVIFVDEGSMEDLNDKIIKNNVKKLISSELFNNIISKKVYFVFMSRYTIVSKMKLNNLSNYGLSNNIIKRQESIPVNSILDKSLELLIIEDEKSGLNYFKELLPITDIISSKSKDNIIGTLKNILKENKYNNIGIIYDYTGISFAEYKIKEYIKNLPTHVNVHIYPISSFEGMIIASNSLSNLTGWDLEKINNLNNSNIYDKEGFLEKELKDFFKANNHFYNKKCKSYKDCLVEDCVLNKKCKLSIANKNLHSPTLEIGNKD